MASPNLIYTLNPPTNQAQGAAGSTIDQMVDLKGIWSVSSGLLEAASDSSLLSSLLLPIDNAAYTSAGQVILVKWKPSSGRLGVVVAADYDPANPTVDTSYRYLAITIDPSSELILANAFEAGANQGYAIYSSGGGTVAYDSTQDYWACVALQHVDGNSVNVYVDYRLASNPSAPVKVAGVVGLTASGALYSPGTAGLTQNSGSPAPQAEAFQYYGYTGTISNNAGVYSATDLPVIGSDLTQPAATLDAPALSPGGVGGVSQTGATLTATAATSGTGPILYQWLISEGWTADTSTMTAQGTPESLASGVQPSALVLTGLKPGTQYSVALQATDSYSPTPGVRTSRVVDFRTFANPDLCLDFMGDSVFGLNEAWTDTSNNAYPNVTESRSLIDEVVQFLQLFLDRRIGYVNGAIPGAKTQDWVPGQGDYTNTLTNYATLISSLEYTGEKVAVCMLGTNDCWNLVDKATYKSNTLARINDLLTNQGFRTCIEHYPSYTADGSNGDLFSAQSLDLMRNQYPAALEELAAATPGLKIGCKDQKLAGMFANEINNDMQYVGGPHLRAMGSFFLAYAHAKAIADVISPGWAGGGGRGVTGGGGGCRPIGLGL